MSQNDGPDAVIVYCRAWCPDCSRAKAWLAERDIDFVEVDVDSDAEARARAEALNHGRLHTPTIVVGEEVCVDFDRVRLCSILGIPG